MSTDAVGGITTAEDLLRTTLAACTAFQTWVNAANTTEALQHIYLEALQPDNYYTDRYSEEELVGRRPFAQIWTDEQRGYTTTREAASRLMWDSGILHIRFEGNVDEAIEHDYAEIDRLFKNTLGQIIQSDNINTPGLVELNQQAGYLAWDTLTMTGPFRCTENQIRGMGDFQEASFEIRWGEQG